MLSLELFAADEAAQEAIGARLAPLLPRTLVIHLRGDLGAGKTTLVRGLVRALGHRGAVKSPTYTLLEPYALAQRDCYHFDLYRLADPEELEYLGIRDLLGSGILLFEWPERAAGLVPPADLTIEIAHEGVGRRLTITAGSEIGEKIVTELQSVSSSA